jgi:predicted AAA+ superfamily ATPase
MKQNKNKKIKPSNIFSFTFDARDLEKRWLRGNVDGSYTATRDQDASSVRDTYFTNYLKTLGDVGFSDTPAAMKKFLTEYAPYQAEVLNATEVAKVTGLSTYAVNNYLAALAKTNIIRVLKPWYQDLTKRQVKTPKIYVKDTGLLHTFLNITTQEQLRAHPKLNNSWKSFVLEEIIAHYKLKDEDCYFWSTHAGTWIDLFIILDGKRIGFEFKCLDKPKFKPAMKISVEDLKLDHLYVIYPGEETLEFTNKITAMGLEQFKNFSL